MREKTIWFASTVGPGIDVDVPSDEPSHIHIPRPSRLRRHNAGPAVEPADERRDLAAAEVMVQAA